MKPRNKLQRKVLECSQGLKPLTEHQRKQAILKVAPHIAKLNSKGVYVCLDCGATWKGEPSEKAVCPYCGANLDVQKDRKRKNVYKKYFAVVTVCRGFQVIRMYRLNTYLYLGNAAEYVINEVYQRWITTEGKSIIVGLQTNMGFYYNESWNIAGDFELRSEKDYAHYFYPDSVVGHSSVIPKLKRNGFTGDLHNMNPHHLLPKLITDNKVETLWKAGQYDLSMAVAAHSRYNIDDYWSEIKIALRHNYIVKDVSLWIDMLISLKWLHKDTHNPKYILPDNLREAHQYWHNKYEIGRRKEYEKAEKARAIKEAEKLKEENLIYQDEKRKYFDICLTNSDITIKPLTSIDEFFTEGQKMHHCVFGMKYYNKKESLIMHALQDGKIIATIEYDLNTFTVLQCRGVCNSIPERKEEIINLINNNRGQFVKRIAS